MPTLEEFVASLPDDEVEILLNDPELLEQAKLKFTQAPPTQQVSEQQPSLLQETAGGIQEGLKKLPIQAATSPLPLPVQGVVALGTPLLRGAEELSRRGTRGLGVGAQRLIEGDEPDEALSRAAEATQPNFQPRAGEKIGAFLGKNALEVVGGIGARPTLRRFLLPSSKRAGKAIEAIESKAGLKVRPTTEIPASKRAKFLEKAARIDPTKMTLQDLRDTMQTVKAVKKATKIKETQKFAGQLESKLRDELTRKLPERAAPAAEFARAKRLRSLFSPISKTAGRLARFFALGTGLEVGRRLLQ